MRRRKLQWTRSGKSWGLNNKNFVSVSKELAQIIGSVDAQLRALGERETSQRPRPEKWSKKEIIGHLIDSASNNHQRFVRAALAGSLSFPGYAQAELVELQKPGELPWALLVELWTSYNRYLAHVIAALPEDAGDVMCSIGDNPPATLLYIADDYVAHIKHHLNQILETKFETSYVPEVKTAVSH